MCSQLQLSSAHVERYGGERFVASDIFQKLPREHLVGTAAHDKQGEALYEALSELLGKPLQRPTSRSIAKLLKRRLIGRPVWLGDNIVATLRIAPSHEANEYWVEVTSPNNTSQLSQTSAINPANPDGNAGTDGIVSPVQRGPERKSWRPGPRIDLSDPAVREQLSQVFRRASGDPPPGFRTND